MSQWPDLVHTVTGATSGEAGDMGTGGGVSREDFRFPSSDLSVVEPAYITLNIEPHDNWNVIVGNRSGHLLNSILLTFHNQGSV